MANYSLICFVLKFDITFAEVGKSITKLFVTSNLGKLKVKLELFGGALRITYVNGI